MSIRNVLALGLVLAFAALPAGAGENDHAQTKAAVSALVQRWSDAGENADWTGVADTYADADGFAWIEQGETRYPSRAAIVDGLDQARQMSATIRNDVSNIVVTPLARGVAAFRTDYFLSVSAEGFAYESKGVLSGVAIRQGRDWRFLQGSFSEMPPAQPAR